MITMRIFALIFLSICLWNIEGHEEGYPLGIGVVLLTDINTDKSSTIDVIEPLSSLKETLATKCENFSLIILQRTRNGGRFCWNDSLGDINQETPRVGLCVKEEDVIPWLMEEKPNIVIYTASLNLPAILSRAQGRGLLPFHTKVVVWLDYDNWKHTGPWFSEVGSSVSFVDKKDMMSILASDGVDCLSETVRGGPFSQSTVHLVSASYPEGMLFEIMKRMRSNIHERIKRNAHGTYINSKASSSAVSMASHSSISETVPQSVTMSATLLINSKATGMALSTASNISVPESMTIPLEISTSSAAFISSVPLGVKLTDDVFSQAPSSSPVPGTVASSSQTASTPGMILSPVASVSVSSSSSPVPGIESTSVGIVASSALNSSVLMVPSPVASLSMSLSSSPVAGIESTSVGIVASLALSSSIPMVPSPVASVSMSLSSSPVPGIESTSVGLVASSALNSSILMVPSPVASVSMSSSSSPVPGIESTSVGIVASSAYFSSIPKTVTSQVKSFSVSSPISHVPGVLSSVPISASSANISSVPGMVSSPVMSTSQFSSISFVPGIGSSASFPETLSASGSSIPGNGSKSLLPGSATSSHHILASKSVGSRSTVETSVVPTGTLMTSSRFVSQAASSSAPGFKPSRSVTAVSVAVKGSVSVTPFTSLQLSPTSKTSVIQTRPLSSAGTQTTLITITPGVQSTAPSRIASSSEIRSATSKVTSIESQVTARESSAIVILPTTTKRHLAPSSTVVATLPSFLNNETFVLVLDGNCQEVTKTEEAVEAFKEDFIKTVVGKLNLGEGTVVVNNVECGSVRVTFTVTGKRQINVTKELNKFIDEGTFTITHGNKVYNGTALEIVHPTTPFTSVPTTVAPKKSQLPLILYLTFGSLIGLAFVIGVVVFIVRYRRSRRGGNFLLPDVHYELEGFENIPRVANYYGEPVAINATEGSPEQQDEFESQPAMHPYNEHLSRRPVKQSSEPGKQVGAQKDDAQNDKVDLTPVGLPEWNLPRLSKSDMTVADAEQNILKSSDSVGSRKLLLAHSDDVSRDAESAFDNSALAFDAADEESKQAT